MDIQQAVPVAPLGELLHPLAPGGVDVLLLIVIRAEHHQVVALEAVVVDDELPVIDPPGMGGLGVLYPDEEAVVLVSRLVPLPVGALHQVVGGFVDISKLTFSKVASLKL